MNVIKKFTNDISATLNAEKDVWFQNLGAVPKFVAYTNTALSDSVNQQLLSSNFYPTIWSKDSVDYNSTEAQIKSVLSSLGNDVVILNEFAESKFTSATLQWYFNSTNKPFNDLCSCYSVSSKWWGNCTGPNPNSGLNSGSSSSGPVPTSKPKDTYSGANRLGWFF
eukprot:NODE_73_length_24441_cov_0.672952.p15 type:complete len:166 gc:universal NODE_73_length_24441_cov_0.672952:24021-23524(-)